MIRLRCEPPGEPASEVRIGAGLAGEVAGWAADRRTFLLADRRVAPQVPPLPADWPRLLIDGGEGAKTFAQVEAVLRALAQSGIDRTGRLLVVGGGSLSDLGGLCASLWLRGIELWVVPTTLLAMADASVGGKNAVNLPEGKNLAGTIHPPALIAVDPGFLRLLPEAEFHSGLGEVVKVAIGLDAELFTFLERERAAVLARAPAAMAKVIGRCVAAKIRVVEADLRESGQRRLLNLGHTLGHALEAHSHYRTAHGACVGRGLHFALRMAVAERAMDDADACAAHQLLAAYGFAEDPLPPTDALMPFLARDKKAEGTKVHFVLPTGIGRSESRPLTLDRIAAVVGPS